MNIVISSSRDYTNKIITKILLFLEYLYLSRKFYFLKQLRLSFLTIPLLTSFITFCQITPAYAVLYPPDLVDYVVLSQRSAVDCKINGRPHPEKCTFSGARTQKLDNLIVTDGKKPHKVSYITAGYNRGDIGYKCDSESADVGNGWEYRDRTMKFGHRCTVRDTRLSGLRAAIKNDHTYLYRTIANCGFDPVSNLMRIATPSPDFKCENVAGGPLYFTSTAITQIAIGKSYNYTPTGKSSTGGTLSFTFDIGAASWLRINKATNTLSSIPGRPNSGDIGNYPITIVLEDGSKLATQNFTITVSKTGTSGGSGGGQQPTNKIPTAKFTVSNNRIIVGETITVDGSSSTDPDGTIKSYKWTFKDGAGTQTTASGVTTSITFKEAGIGDISLIVNDGTDNSPAVSKSVQIKSVGDVRNRGGRTGGVMCLNGTNPVNGADGNKVQPETDYTGVGKMPLNLTRYYNSLTTKKEHLGSNWRHSYDQSIELDDFGTPIIAYVYLADGSSIQFTQSGITWKADPGVTQKLTDTAAEWTLTAGNITKTFQKIAGKNARLIKISDRLSISQTLTYVAGRLDKVTDDYGRSLNFGYDASGRVSTVTDPAGKIIKYSYVNDNIDTVTYQDLTTRNYLYTDTRYPHYLTGIKDQNSNIYASWTYDAQGRANSSTHAGGANKVGIVYNIDGTTTFTDALGQARTHSFSLINGIQKLDKITGPACNVCGGRSQNNAYDANGFRDIVTDFKGNITDYNYNAQGLLEQIIEAKGSADQRITKTVWDTALKEPTCVIAPGNTTHNIYTANGQIKTRTVYETSDASLFAAASTKTCTAIQARADIASLNKSTTGYTYYPSGLLQTVDGSRTDVQDITGYTYDTKGNLSTITNASNQATQLQNYDAHGRAQTIIDANGLITTITYDLLSRKDIVTVGQQVTNYDYYPNGLLDKVTLPDGSFLDYRYDAAGRKTDVYDQLGNHTHYTLNLVGSIKQTDTSDPTGLLKRTQSAQYSLENRLSKTLGAAKQSTDYLKYDANGNLELIRDPGTNNTSYTYDALDRLKTTTDAKLGVTTTTYDSQDNVTSIKDPRGNITTYKFDGLGNQTQLISPDTGTTNFTSYDAAGNLLSMTNALGKTTSYQYDALNRLDLITYQDGTTTDYVYDVGVNAKGRLSSVVYTGATLLDNTTDSWTYDIQGHVLTKTQLSDGITLTTQYTYNALSGNVETKTTPGGHVIAYTYLKGQISSIAVDTKLVLSNISYDPFGPPIKWTFGNGSITNRVYNKDGQLVNYPEAGVVMTNTYFATGNVKDVKEAGTAPTIFDSQYTYDVLNRVITFAADENTEAYDYDANNNRILQKINQQSFTSIFAATNNQLNSTPGPITKTYTYDLAGNTTADGIHTYQYDDRGRLFGLDNYVKYTINGLGQRVRKIGGFERSGDIDEDGVVNNNDRVIIENAVAAIIPAAEIHDRNNDKVVNQSDVTQFDTMVSSGRNSETFDFDERFVYNSQGQLEGEYDGFGNVVQEYIWFTGMPVAVVRGVETFYIDSDHLGSPISISDQSQSVIWEWDAEPYGRALPDVDFDDDHNLFVFNLRFPGQYYDHESGLHYNINRFYDPSTGRYLESDPIGLAGGLNTYGYVDGNPVNKTDPKGLATEAALAVCVLGGPINPACDAAVVVNGVKWIGIGVVVAGTAIYNMCTNDDAESDRRVLQQEIEKAANRQQYHNRCDEKPPQGGFNDLCAGARWRLDKAKGCKKLRMDFSNKWYNSNLDAEHIKVMNELNQSIRNAEKAVKRQCR